MRISRKQKVLTKRPFTSGPKRLVKVDRARATSNLFMKLADKIGVDDALDKWGIALNVALSALRSADYAISYYQMQIDRVMDLRTEDTP
jgi:hypothetical protein